jgi:hypothetical protein
MSDLDLDIQHYSISDMERFFRLNPKKKYDAADIELREYEIREQLLSSGHIHKSLKRDLIAFLKDVKERIIEEKCKKVTITTPYVPLDSMVNPKDYPKVPYPSSNVREQDIIAPTSTPYIYTQNTEFLPGTLNPISKRTLSRCISIDTRFRESPYSTSSSDFGLNIPNKIQKVLSMQLVSLELCTDSLYNISAVLQNNYLNISVVFREEELQENQSFTNTFVLPDGHYSAEHLICLLNTLFQNKLEEAFSLICWKLDTDSQRVILESTSEAIVSISLDFTVDIHGQSDKNTSDYFNKLGRVLGFTRRKYSGECEYLGETAICPNYAFSYFFLDIEDFQNHYSPSFVSVFSKIAMPNSVLARISDFDRKGGKDLTIVSEPRTYFGAIDITRLNIRLLNAYGQVLDMNGADFSFCLLLNVVYDF